jgi:hypothetical protein
MDIAAAIGTLAHNDPSIQSEAIDICENFQTPSAFDFKTCAALIRADQPVQFRIFGYNSLRSIISCPWDVIASETQGQITSLFPFCDPEEVIESSLFHTIVRCASSLLTIVMPLDLIESLFRDLRMLMFTSVLFSEFIVSVDSNGMASVRYRGVPHFLRQPGVVVATALVIGPLFECEVGGEIFAFSLHLLADVHRFSPRILEALFSESDVANWYTTVAGFLWEPTSNVSIMAIMETAMVNSYLVHHLASAFCASANDVIPDNFGIFFRGVISDPQLDVTLLLTLLNRLYVFFEALEKLGPDKMLDFLKVIPLFLRSIAQSIMGDAAVYMMEMIGRNDSLTAFVGGFFELYLSLISTPLESFAGAPLGEYWSEATFRRLLFDLAQVIANYSDLENHIKKLVRNILQCTKENCEFVSLVLILSFVGNKFRPSPASPFFGAAGMFPISAYILCKVDISGCLYRRKMGDCPDRAAIVSE